MAALAGPLSSDCAGRAQVTLPCPAGLAAKLTHSQGLEGCLQITPHLCLSPLVTRSKRQRGLEGDCSHSPHPSMALWPYSPARLQVSHPNPIPLTQESSFSHPSAPSAGASPPRFLQVTFALGPVTPACFRRQNWG